MRIVVGLGNPGPRYANTRHNAGFRIIDTLARRFGTLLEASPWEGRFARVRRGGLDVGLLQPTTFMNRSGDCVRAATLALTGSLSPEPLLVIYDDLDLPLGRVRLRPRGGCGGHRGMESIAGALGTEDFGRLRFGIGRPAPAAASPRCSATEDAGAAADGNRVVDHVLSPFTAAEEELAVRATERAADAVEAVLASGFDAAMSAFNRDAQESSEDLG